MGQRPVQSEVSTVFHPEAAELQRDIDELRDQKYDLQLQLEDLERLLAEKRTYFLDKIGANLRNRKQISLQLEMVLQEGMQETLPGPSALKWASGPVYAGICTLVTCLNLGVMWYEVRHESPAHPRLLWLSDQLFLIWYISEILFKAILYQHQLFAGDFRTVIWHWLDLMLVLVGVFDQWIMPSVDYAEGRSHIIYANLSRAVRLLRMLRFIRAFKAVGTFLHMELSWCEGVCFQTFMLACIGVNTVLLGVELDYPWHGWATAEQVLLAIYIFELAARMKLRGWWFFTEPGAAIWNCLDFTIVAVGVLESWLLPWFYVSIAQSLALEAGGGGGGGGGEPNITNTLRMCRLGRIARMLRVLRSIKPLYNLIQGVVKAMHGMQWVLALTFAVLYACSILSTYLVGHGIIYGHGKPPPAAREVFGTVPLSFLHLFKLMNNDQSVVAPLLSSVFVKGFFVVFMVISNWSMLAILTAVVSNYMIAQTTEDEKRHDAEKRMEALRRRDALIRDIARAADTDNSGTIDENEFKAFFRDTELKSQLCEASGLCEGALLDIFMFLSVEDKTGQRVVDYEDLIDALYIEDHTVTERTVFRIEERVRAVESRLLTRFDHLLQMRGICAKERRSILIGAEPDHIRRQKRTRSLDKLYL